MRVLSCLLVVLMLGALVLTARGDGFEARRDALLQAFAARPLPQGPRPETWVDAERWCVAHACLETGTRLDEANLYLEQVQPVALWRGLVADTDVQVTDLLWTFLRFRESDRLHPAAREHLLEFFRQWRVPNPDRNRNADAAYEWPAEYTENHSLNILAAAYLIDSILERDRARRRDLLAAFLLDRAKWGWSEFHSPSYTLVTVKVLSILASAAPDESIARSSRMHLDLLALDFAQVALGTWRGMPHARGYGSEGSNAGNSIADVAGLWFGDPAPSAKPGGNPYLLQLATGSYRPPALAERLVRDPGSRGTYVFRKTATHGPGRQRIPIVAFVTPVATMASAQGSGSYYDGSYCSISFASSPNAVVTARDGKRYAAFQRRNVLAAAGEVAWHGPLKPDRDGAVAIGGDGRAWVGQIDLADGWHLLVLETADACPAQPDFRRLLDGLHASATGETVRWTEPDGARVELRRTREGSGWALAGAAVDGRPVRLDSNMLFDSPTLRGVRESLVVEALDGQATTVYDFRDPAAPVVRREKGRGLTPAPAERLEALPGMAFVYVPGGSFVMGSGPAEGRANERPQRWVDVGAFYVSETEVTVGQYRQFLAANPSHPPPPDWYWAEWGRTDGHPMTWVSGSDAEAFCRWLAGRADRACRLPTEAEWEKAAKGYGHRAYPWGDAYDGTQSGTKNGTYAPVATMPMDVSPFGARDMAGNAWEWCADWYAADAYATQPAVDPKGPATGSQRVLRGCGWNFDPDTFRCAYRSRLEPAERSVHLGFRVVAEAAPGPAR